VQPLGEAPRVALSDAVPVPNDVAAAVLAGKGALTTGQVLAKHTAGLDPQDWHARLDARGRTRTRIVADALAPLLAELQAELERSGRLALDVAEDAPDVFVAEAGRLRVRLPVKSTPHGAMAFFDLFHPAALAANARLGAELATRLPPEVDVIVSPEGKGVLLAHEVARAARRELVVLRKKARGFDVVAHALEYRSVTTPEPQSLHLTAAVAARVRGKHVAIVDDVVSTGGTVNALRELLTLGGASSVAVVAVFTEGSPRADVITLGHLPFPVPAEALLRA
jgi:adenine phosphoribosyltransferase